MKAAAIPLLALAAALPLLRAQQPAAPAVKTASTVYSNPRAAANDPRIGLKGGLYDAGEAAFGVVRLATLPKPPGFAPDSTNAANPNTPGAPDIPAAPVPTADAAAKTSGAPPTPPRPQMTQYGATNSDLAFAGNHLFVGNYKGINTYDIDNPKEIKLRTSLVCPGGSR